MKSVLPLVVLTVCGLWFAPCLCFDPYSPGPHAVVQVKINHTQYAPGLSVHMSAWAPAEAGVYPVVYFFDGFQSTMPVEVYGDALERVSTHGFVVAAPWNFTDNFRPEEKLDAMQHVFDWTYDNLDSVLIAAGASSDLITDYQTAFAMSHSAGGHMVCSYLQLSGCENFKGMALTSPVDGVDPFGVVDDYCTSLDSTLNFSIPTIVMAAGLDDVPGSNLTSTTCAPADMSNMRLSLRFYRALDPDSPRWFLNATEFGHFDYCNLLFQEAAAVSHFCATNREAGLLEFSKYRSFVPGTAVAFFFSLLEDDCQTYLPYLQDTSAMPVAVVGEYVNQGEATGQCPRGYCSRVPSVDQN